MQRFLGAVLLTALTIPGCGDSGTNGSTTDGSTSEAAEESGSESEDMTSEGLETPESDSDHSPLEGPGGFQGKLTMDECLEACIPCIGEYCDSICRAAIEDTCGWELMLDLICLESESLLGSCTIFDDPMYCNETHQDYLACHTCGDGHCDSLEEEGGYCPTDCAY